MIPVATQSTQPSEKSVEYYGIFNRSGGLIQSKLQDVFIPCEFDCISNKWGTMDKKKAMR